jgi:hypothetical protein
MIKDTKLKKALELNKARKDTVKEIRKDLKKISHKYLNNWQNKDISPELFVQTMLEHVAIDATALFFQFNKLSPCTFREKIKLLFKGFEHKSYRSYKLVWKKFAKDPAVEL